MNSELDRIIGEAEKVISEIKSRMTAEQLEEYERTKDDIIDEGMIELQRKFDNIVRMIDMPS